MATTEQLQSLLQRVDERERNARRRAIVYSLIPIALAVILLGFTGNQIQQAVRQVQEANQELATVDQKLQKSQQDLGAVNDQLAQARTQINQSQQQLDTVNSQLAKANDQVKQSQQQLDAVNTQLGQVNEQLKQSQQQVAELKKELADASSFLRFKFSGNILLDLKGLYSEYPRQGDVLQHILQMQSQNVPWKAGGFSPEEGFDSPSFAAYILVNHQLLTLPSPEARYSLRDILPNTPQPRIGDLVFYPTGYSMFYFLTESQEPYVIGMTPFGIIALQLKFAPVLGYGRVNYY